ncbi:dihydroneopterin aldolase [Rickettsiales bacterium]|nr:dihydroneopterin aldolase [Rickettsiales bacterium]
MINNITQFEINNLKIDTIIGIHSHERMQTQEIILDLIIYFDSTNAIESDHINDVVDYYDLSSNLVKFVSQSEFDLIETLSYKILEMISKDDRIQKAILTITKPKALEDFGAIVKVTNEYNI